MLISRKDLSNFPCFFNHDSARMWLKEKYGKFFVLSDVSYHGERKLYHYHLVQDKHAYLEWREALMEQQVLNDDLYTHLYQSVIVSEDGKLTILFKEDIKEAAF